MKILNNADVAKLFNTMVHNAYGTTTTEEGASEKGLLVKEDLSNLVEAGTALSSDITIENMQNIVTGMLEGVGKIIYENATLESPSEFGIAVDTSEFLTILEKVRIRGIEFERSHKYDTSGGSTFEDMFNNHALDFSVKIWNTLTNWRTKPYTISLQQLKSSVMNEKDLSKLLGEIYAVVEVTYYTALQEAEKRVIFNQMANCAMYDKARNTAESTNKSFLIIDVLEEYKKFSNVSLTTETMHNSDDFKRWFYGFWKHQKMLLAKPTVRFNAEENLINTKGDNYKSFLIEPFVTSLQTIAHNASPTSNLNAINDAVETAFLQNINEPDTIDIVPADPPTLTVGKVVTGVKIVDVIGMMFDKRGCLISGSKIDTGAVENKFDKWTNYVHNFDLREMCDKGSNAIVFVAHDATGATKAYTITEENASS